VALDVELANFSPVVEEVEISYSSGTAWHALWKADGLTPELDVIEEHFVGITDSLDVEIVFSEPMDTTSVTVTAGASSPYDDITATETGWSSTNYPDAPSTRDTWHGDFDDISSCPGGWTTLSVSAQDMDGNGLSDPSSTDDGGVVSRYDDTHHGFNVNQLSLSWTSSLHDAVYGSAVIADLDDDGDLDIAIQSEEGWIHVLDDDGSALNANWPCTGGWGVSTPDVKASPTLADLDEDGDIDLLTVNPYGCRAYDVATGNALSGWPQYFNFNWTYFLGPLRR